MNDSNNQQKNFKLNESSFFKEKNSEENNDINRIEDDPFKNDLLTLEELKSELPTDIQFDSNQLNKKCHYDFDENWNKKYIINILKNEDIDADKKEMFLIHLSINYHMKIGLKFKRIIKIY